MLRNTCVSDGQLLIIFNELDKDGSGSVSVAELSKAVRLNAGFAKLMGVASENGRCVNALAAGLIANNLRRLLDEEVGDSDSVIGPEEFRALIRKLAPAGYGAASRSIAMQTASRGRIIKDTPAAIEPKSKESFFSCGSKGGAAGKAAAEAAADARISALQRMLREEVVGGLEGVLERARNAPDHATRVAAYHQGVCDTLSACKRLLDLEDGASVETGSAEAEAIELHTLRRDLAATKVALAESESARARAFENARAFIERELSASRGRFNGR